MQEFSDFKRKRNKRDLMPTLLLLLALVIIWFLGGEIKKNMPEPPADLPVLKDNAMSGILDSTYYNYTHWFSAQTPSEKWEMNILTFDTTLNTANLDLSIFSQVTWLLEMINSSQNATAQIGVLNWPEYVDSKNIAINLMAELLQKFETPKLRGAVLQPVAQPAHRVLQGAFFGLILPKQKTELPVWIVSVIPRQQLLYFIVAKTTEEHYSALYKDFEQIVSQFTPLSKMRQLPYEKK